MEPEYKIIRTTYGISSYQKGIYNIELCFDDVPRDYSLVSIGMLGNEIFILMKKDDDEGPYEASAAVA